MSDQRTTAHPTPAKLSNLRPPPALPPTAARRFVAVMAEIGRSLNTCSTCAEYLEVRRGVLEREVRMLAIELGVSRAVLFGRLMRGVHARHLAGEPILPGGTS